MNKTSQPVNPSETPVQSNSIPTNNQRSNSPIILGVLVMLLVGVGAYYLGTQSNNSQSPQVNNPTPTTSQQPNVLVTPTVNPTELPQSSPTQTAQIGYKTYSNTKYGFSFEYPSNLTPRKDSTPEFTGFLEKPNENQSQRLVVFVVDNPQNLGLEEFVKQNKPIPYDWTDKSFDNKIINGLEVLVKKSERPCIGCESAQIEKGFVTYLKGDKFVISFSVDNRASISDTKPDEEWLNPVLFTFKFTN